MKQFDIAVVGGVCVDILVGGVELANAFKYEATPASSISLCVGGDAVNEAVTAHKLGSRVRLVSGVGTDFAGKLVLDYLHSCGLEAGGIRVTEGATSLNCVVVDVGGERRFLSPPFAASASFPIDETAADGTKVLSLASLFVPPLLCQDELLPLVRRAHEQGALICSDLNMAAGRSLEDYREVLPYIDYLFPNEEESAYYTHETDVLRAAEVFRSFGVGAVIAKEGRRGSYLCTGEGVQHVPVYESPRVDTTGAGDNFAAGFMTGLAMGYTPYDCCRLATATASVAITQIGATTAVKNLEQVLRVMECGRVQ